MYLTYAVSSAGCKQALQQVTAGALDGCNLFCRLQASFAESYRGMHLMGAVSSAGFEQALQDVTEGATSPHKLVVCLHAYFAAMWFNAVCGAFDACCQVCRLQTSSAKGDRGGTAATADEQWGPPSTTCALWWPVCTAL